MTKEEKRLTQIMNEIKTHLKTAKSRLQDRNVYIEKIPGLTKGKKINQIMNEIEKHLNDDKFDSRDLSNEELYIKILDNALFENNNKYTYTDSSNGKGMIRLDVIDPKFIFENIYEIPPTAIFRYRCAIIENGKKKLSTRLCFLFKKDRESRELFDAIKNSEINKIFDGKCELFIELDNRTDIQLLMSPNQRSRIPMVPEFIVDHIFPKIPEDEILKKILAKCSHQRVSQLIILLPIGNYIAIRNGKNITVYYFNTKKKLYEIINEDCIRTSIQDIVVKFVNFKCNKENEELNTMKDNLKNIKIKIKNLKEKIEKAKKSEKTKFNAELEQFENEEDEIELDISDKDDHINRFDKVLTNLENVNFMNCVTKRFITEPSILKENFMDILDKRMDVFNFKKGLVELKTGKFRKRTADDYFTITLDYNYHNEYDTEIFNKINNIILQICNDNDDLAECYKSWLGYCMTGETSEQRAWWSIGPTAQNGKSTMIEAFEKMAHLYCVKLNSKTFDEKFQNKHKQLALLKLARLAYFEEMERRTIDIQAYKDYVGAHSIGGNEILYGTAESIRIFFKLMFVSNKFPKFKSDAGVKRRGFCMEHTNLFYDNKIYEANKHKKGVYLKDTSLGEQFERDDYKLAFFHLLLPYAKRYYSSKFTNIDMSSLIETWENICCENDNVAQFIEEYYECTGKEKDRVQKEDFLRHYQQVYDLKKMTWNTLMGEVKRLAPTYNIIYDKDKQKNNKKGVIVGLTLKKTVSNVERKPTVLDLEDDH